MKKYIMVLFLFCCCLNVYGQESIKDTTEIVNTTIETINWINSDATIDLLPYYLNSLIELYEEYETECFNDSTKQCFNYYRNYYLDGSFENYKTPCGKYDYDLGIDASFMGTHEEWMHVQPSFLEFMRYLKKKR